jgi:hypothetical protein
LCRLFIPKFIHPKNVVLVAKMAADSAGLRQFCVEIAKGETSGDYDKALKFANRSKFSLFALRNFAYF